MQTGNALTFFESLKTEVNTLKNENTFLKSQNIEIKQTLNELLDSRKDLVNQINFLKDTLSKLLNDQSYLHSFCAEMQNEMKALRYENADLKSKHSLLDLKFKRSQPSNEYENLSSRGNKDFDLQKTLTTQSARLDTYGSEDASVREKAKEGTLEKLENLKKKMEVAFEETKEKKRRERLLQIKGTTSRSSPTEHAKSARLVSNLPLQELLSTHESSSTKELRHSYLTEPLGGHHSAQRRHLSSPNPHETLLKMQKTSDVLTNNHLPMKSSGQNWLGNEHFGVYNHHHQIHNGNVQENDYLFNSAASQNTNYPSGKKEVFSSSEGNEGGKLAMSTVINPQKTILTPTYHEGGFIHYGGQLQTQPQIQQIQATRFQEYSKSIPSQNPEMFPKTWIQDHYDQQYLHPQNPSNTKFIDYNINPANPVKNNPQWISNDHNNNYNTVPQTYRENVVENQNKEANKYPIDPPQYPKNSENYTVNTQEPIKNEVILKEAVNRHPGGDQKVKQLYIELEDPSQKLINKSNTGSTRTGNLSVDLNTEAYKIQLDQSLAGYHYTTPDTTRSMTQGEYTMGDGDLLKKSMMSDTSMLQDTVSMENLVTRSTKKLILTKKGKGSVDMKGKPTSKTENET